MDNKAYAVSSKYYDAAYKLVQDKVDLPFYLDLAVKSGGPVLEIACGTGRILLPTARKGIRISGIDASPDQLRVLRNKLALESKAVRNLVDVRQADMRDFDLNRKFRLITIPFRPMQHMYTLEDQIRALSAAKRHLAPDGLLAFNVFFPYYPAFYKDLGREITDLSWKDPGNPKHTVTRYFIRHKVDMLNQWFTGEFIYRTRAGKRVVKVDRAPLKMNWYTYPHMLLLFRECGLKIYKEYGSFKKEPISACKEMIFLLKITK